VSPRWLLGIGGSIVAIANYVVNERQIDVKMIEIAVGLIRQPQTDQVQPAREWAVDVLTHCSDVKLSPQARAAAADAAAAKAIEEC
jgi:hypothetical protein